MTELAAAKEYWSTHHAQSARVLPKGEGQDHRYELAEFILKMKPKSVLEFGCSSGRNLGVIKSLAAHPIKLMGIDMNVPAIAAGNRMFPDINLTVGDERELRNYEPNSVDVVFTCSVLDHIPTPDWRTVYDQLVQIARIAVVMLEPIYIREDKTGDSVYEGDLNDLRDEFFPNGMRVVPYTYSWHYQKHDPEIRIHKRVVIPTDAQDSGEYYWLMERRK